MSHKEHEQFQVSQKGLLYDSSTNKFLLVKASDPSQGKVDPYWYEYFGPWDFIGGRVNVSEALDDAFVREISEEAGDILYESLGVVGITEVQITGGRRVLYAAHLISYTGGDIVLDGEHCECRWVTAEEIETSKDYRPWIKELIRVASMRLKEREYLNDLKRLQADFDNYRKRQEESKKELGNYLIEKLVMELIPVLDNFQSATQHVPETSKGDPWVTGIQYIEKQLEDTLASNGMQIIDVKEGDAFDPRLHEAIGQTGEENATEDENKGTTIARVLQKGYKLGERVIRPAKVVVS